MEKREVKIKDTIYILTLKFVDFLISLDLQIFDTFKESKPLFI